MPSWDRLTRCPAFTFVRQGAAPHDLATVEVAPEYRATILEFLVRAMKAEKLRGHLQELYHLQGMAVLRSPSM